MKNEGPRKSATPELEPDFYTMPELSNCIQDAALQGSLTDRSNRRASLEVQQLLAGSPVTRNRALSLGALDPAAFPISMGLRGSLPTQLPSFASPVTTALGQDYYRNRLFAQQLYQSHQPQLPQLQTTNPQQQQSMLLNNLRQQHQQHQFRLQEPFQLQNTLLGSNNHQRHSLSLTTSLLPHNRNAPHRRTASGSILSRPIQNVRSTTLTSSSFTAPTTSQQGSQVAPRIPQQGSQQAAAQLPQAALLPELERSMAMDETNRLLMEMFQQQQQRDDSQQTQTSPGRNPHCHQS